MESWRNAVIDQTLLDGTAATITRWGLDEATLGRIAADAGMSRATIYPQPGPEALDVDAFAEPVERLLRDGVADGPLRDLPPVLTATALFDLVGWGYLGLRAAHDWIPETTAETLLDFVLSGLTRQGNS